MNRADIEDRDIKYISELIERILHTSKYINYTGAWKTIMEAQAIIDLSTILVARLDLVNLNDPKRLEEILFTINRAFSRTIKTLNKHFQDKPEIQNNVYITIYA